MTTDEALDLLDRLTSPVLAKKAEQERSRPQDRSPLRYFRADITSKPEDIQAETRRPGNSQFDQNGAWLDLDVTEVYEGNAEPGEHRLWVRIPNPRTQRGEENKANINSEATLMLDSANLTSLRQLAGRKGVVFKEDVHSYETRQNTNEPDPQRPSQTIWRDTTLHTFYYRLALAGTSVSNGATAPSTEPSEASNAAALALLVDSMEEIAFNLAASKDPVIKKDSAMVKAIASGAWVRDQIAAGKVVRDGKTLVAV